MQTILEKMEVFITDYVSFESDATALPVALWAIGTHVFDMFDAYPYMVITSATKRSGKTRLSELVGFLSKNPQPFSAMTPSTLFRVIEERKPTVIFDEAEVLSSESASTMRAVLNVGYRKGQTIPRTEGRTVRNFSTYCPKIFVLIGDVYDTLRDRSIVISMRRSEPRKRFAFDAVIKEAKELTGELAATLEDHKVGLKIGYDNMAGIDFLTDRDEEIWRSLMTICSCMFPHRLQELRRIAVDLAAEKTIEKKRYVELAEADSQVEAAEYGNKLLADLHKVMGHDLSVYSDEAIERLTALDLSPWRRFRGGLTVQVMADLLSRFGVKPTLIRNGKKVRRGYRRKQVDAAFKLHLKG